MSEPDDDGALVTNAADRKQVRRGRQTEKTRAAARLADLEWVMSDPRGRRFIFDQIEQRAVFEDCAGPIEVVARFLGQRSAGLRLYQDVVVLEELFLKMQAEHYEAAKQERRANAAARTPKTTMTD